MKIEIPDELIEERQCIEDNLKELREKLPKRTSTLDALEHKDILVDIQFCEFKHTEMSRQIGTLVTEAITKERKWEVKK